MAPVVSAYVTSPQLGDQTLQLLGIDAFAEPPFRSYLGNSLGLTAAQLGAFLTQPGAVMISAQAAALWYWI